VKHIWTLHDGHQGLVYK